MKAYILNVFDTLNIPNTWNDINAISFEFLSVTVPGIEDLYFNSEATCIKWEIMAFIMGFDDIIMTAIKSLPREFRLVCTALLVLVKVFHSKKSEMVMITFLLFIVWFFNRR